MDEFYEVLLKFWRLKATPTPSSSVESLSIEPIEQIEIPDDDADEDKEDDLSGVMEVVKVELDEEVEPEITPEEQEFVKVPGESLLSSDPYLAFGGLELGATSSTEAPEEVEPKVEPKVEVEPKGEIKEECGVKPKDSKETKAAYTPTVVISDDELDARINFLKCLGADQLKLTLSKSVLPLWGLGYILFS